MKYLNGMTIHEEVQGTPEWHRLRAAHLCASDAPTAAGINPYKKLEKLLEEKVAGIKEEVPANVQKLFDEGHKTEAMAREVLLADGYEFTPMVGSREVDGLPLLASFDGIDTALNIGFEHKLYNGKLFESLKQGFIPEWYQYQLEQQMIVGGLDGVLFVCSDGTDVKMARVLYSGDPEIRWKLLDAWENYQRLALTFKPKEKLVANDTEGLPMLFSEVEGRVINTNIEAYKKTALGIIAGINLELVTDQDFIQAEADVKWCQSSEEELEKVKKGILSQTVSINEILIAIDEIKEDIRTKRLALSGRIKTEKETRKKALVNEAMKELAKHLAEISSGLPILVPATTDFESVIKGKKNLDSMKSALTAYLSDLKFQAGIMRERMKANLAKIELAGNPVLFPDKNQLLILDPEYVELEVDSRVRKLKEEEERKKAAQAPAPAPEARNDAQQASIPEKAAAPIPEPQEFFRLTCDDFVAGLKVDDSFIVINQPSGKVYKAVVFKTLVTIQASSLEELAQKYQQQHAEV